MFAVLYLHLEFKTEFLLSSYLLFAVILSVRLVGTNSRGFKIVRRSETKSAIEQKQAAHPIMTTSLAFRLYFIAS